MAAKKNPTVKRYETSDPPEKISNMPNVWGLVLDPNQVIFADEIWDEANRIVFCEACSGSGKTTVSVAIAEMLYHYFPEKYNKIVYVMQPYGEKIQGYLPGGQTQKSSVYFQPLWDAYLAIGINPYSVINTQPLNGFCEPDDKEESAMAGDYTGDGHVYAITDTYFRGINLDHAIVIFDEAQNYAFGKLQECLTRCHDDCKTIVIGQVKQRDISEAAGGFETYLAAAEADDRIPVCKLSVNHRGWVSTWADNVCFYNNASVFKDEGGSTW